MWVSSMEVRGYGSLTQRTLSFSPGVNLLTGDNGVGKSTVLHALAWALWGQKIRGVELSEGAQVSLTLRNEDVHQHPGTVSLLRFITSSGERVQSPYFHLAQANKTRAAEVLQAAFGDFRAWRRSLYMTGKESSRFSSGTPVEKLTHLVQIIGASHQDKAIELLRQRRNVAVREAEKEASRTIATRASVDSGRYGLEAALKQRESVLARCDPDLPVPTKEELTTLTVLGRACRAAASNKSLEMSLLAQQERCALAYKEAKDRLKAQQVQPCPTCGKPRVLPGEVSEESLVSLKAEWEAASVSYQTVRRKLRDMDRLGDFIDARWRQKREECQRQAGALADLKSAQREVARSAHSHASALVEWAQHLRKLSKLITASEDLRLAVAALESARKRYLLQHRAGIEGTANLYLEQIGSPLRINLNLEDEKLQILTSGTGAPDYDSCSSGQQRRIDLCLLLAMSHIAAEVGTLPQSAPLFIDEAFDTLDESGREALVQLALVLSETRQVFLVSHVDPQLPSTTSLRRIHLE